ncbi:PREDICTED: tumor necrosis factor receptor superfamily member 8 [Hipposideros armiger]|uniref:Tumor necrosis factor receptor superfamily member 8 n=1 Tax=Hipposideros armiger TaxID=186990 RepID=A0A8B7R537_HIPAR|nr:PREDICTED: tumor necrosis factor receptor superfamily member 8 [Hipposideros armiger]
MCTLHPVLGLLLVGALRAFPQNRAPADACARDPGHYYDKDAGKCCYRCPTGHFPKRPCPQGSFDCCDPDYYLDKNNRCTACVSCGDNLVEKKPCSRNSSRVCECRAGMFCLTTAANSCARCSPHSTCPTGLIVKFQGTAERDTVCELPSPGASPDCSTSPEDCEAPASGTTLHGKPILTSASSNARTTLLGRDTLFTPENDSKMTRTPIPPPAMGKPSPDPGLSPQLCPQGSSDCRKQCDKDYFLDRDGRCTACVSCSGGDLVEKTPCTWNSSRVCECRPGMVCVTSVTNSCARCIACPTFPLGTAEKDTAFEPSSTGTHLNCNTNPEDSKAPSSTALTDSETRKGHGEGVTHALGDASISTSAPISFSSMGRPILVSGGQKEGGYAQAMASTGSSPSRNGPTLLWLIMALVVVAVSSSFLLCHRRACWKWIRQKLHLCYPVQTFRPKLDPVDSRPRRNTMQLTSTVTDPCTEKLGLMSPPAVETCPNVGATSLESLRLRDASPVGSPSSPRELPEPRVTTEHTNNRIGELAC